MFRNETTVHMNVRYVSVSLVAEGKHRKLFLRRTFTRAGVDGVGHAVAPRAPAHRGAGGVHPRRGRTSR